MPELLDRDGVLVTRERILRIAQRTPEVSVALRHWHNGHLTWEEAMMLAVVELDNTLAKLRQRMIDKLAQGPPA